MKIHLDANEKRSIMKMQKKKKKQQKREGHESMMIAPLIETC